jgi:hypothetical protein
MTLRVTRGEQHVKLWRLTVLVKTMETNYYRVTRLITTLQSYKERRTRSFDAVIVVIDDGEKFSWFSSPSVFPPIGIYDLVY